jgi:hypothetical protein
MIRPYIRISGWDFFAFFAYFAVDTPILYFAG